MQKWTESALLDSPPEVPHNNSSWQKQKACSQYAAAEAENQRLKRQLGEARTMRSRQAAQRRLLTKQLAFKHHSLHALTAINIELNERAMALREQHSEEVSRFRLQMGKVCSIHDFCCFGTAASKALLLLVALLPSGGSPVAVSGISRYFFFRVSRFFFLA